MTREMLVDNFIPESAIDGLAFNKIEYLALSYHDSSLASSTLNLNNANVHNFIYLIPP